MKCEVMYYDADVVMIHNEYVHKLYTCRCVLTRDCEYKTSIADAKCLVHEGRHPKTTPSRINEPTNQKP